MKLSVLTRNITLAAALLAASAAQSADLKYIFYFIGDGMGVAEATNAQIFNQEVRGAKEPLLMTTFPVASMITTHSASSRVTDSAAAGTALATGSKTRNGMLGMNADTVAVTSVARTLADNGYGVALVTSVAIDDATPAAFYTHVPNRSMFHEIGRDLAHSGYQFAAGASLRGTRDKDGNDNGLMDLFKQNNVSVSYGLDGLDTTAERVLVLSPFHEKSPNEIGYTIDSIAGALTLPALTEAALKHMERTSPERFFMMVEGGNIDHAGHSNDGGTSVREVINFNEALQIAYDFYLQHPDETLILVTADHETGGMSVGCRKTGYSVHAEVAAGQRISKDTFNDFLKSKINSRAPFTWEDMELYMTDNLGYGKTFKVSDTEREQLRKLFAETFAEGADSANDVKTLYSSSSRFVEQVLSLLNSKSGFGWTTGDHTGHPVPVYAIGNGMSEFTNFNDNTDLPKKILRLTGVKQSPRAASK